jgi:hypothetical protein
MEITKHRGRMALTVAVLVVVAVLVAGGAANGGTAAEPSAGPIWYYYGSADLPAALGVAADLPYTYCDIYEPVVSGVSLASQNPVESMQDCWYYYGSPKLPAVLAAIEPGAGYWHYRIYTPKTVDDR